MYAPRCNGVKLVQAIKKGSVLHLQHERNEREKFVGGKMTVIAMNVDVLMMKVFDNQCKVSPLWMMAEVPFVRYMLVEAR